MGKYTPLGDFLRAKAAGEIPMTFREIERVIGAPLPPKAPHHRAWWSNNPTNNVMTRVWLDAGYRTEHVDLERQRLVFKKIEDGEASIPRRGGRIEPKAGTSRRHPLFGVLEGIVEIAPGTDLTEPADPDWGNR